LKGHSSFAFLDDDWLCARDLPPHRNRLVNTVNKILSVVSPQTVASIRDGLRRAYKYRSGSKGINLVVPPHSVLLHFFRSSSHYRVDGDSISLTSLIDYRTLLGEGELALVD